MPPAVSGEGSPCRISPSGLSGSRRQISAGMLFFFAIWSSSQIGYRIESQAKIPGVWFRHSPGESFFSTEKPADCSSCIL